MSTTISIILAIAFIAVVIYFLFRAERNEIEHLERLHINPDKKD